MVEGVHDELQARRVERGEGKGTHCLDVGIHMQRCEAEKANPDQQWHLCTQASQASAQVQGSLRVYMLSCTWACCDLSTCTCSAVYMYIHIWLAWVFVSYLNPYVKRTEYACKICNYNG